jgi:hypothetical protein
MKIYHKINSIYKRDPATNYRTFLDGDWSDPVFDLLADLQWTFTEKVDGTNIRIGWDGQLIRLGGRTGNAQIPAPLVNYIKGHFTYDRLSEGLKGPVTLVGEGYGGKIQKGSGYQEEQRFILFDVFVEPTEDHPLGIWLEREIVEEIAAALDIPVVPVLFKAPLLDGVDYVKGRPESLIAEDPSLVMEGVVTRPSTELRDRLGRRVITKIKVRDFDETNER